MHLDPVPLHPFQPFHPSPRGRLPLHWAGWTGRGAIEKACYCGDGNRHPPSSETYYGRTIEKAVGEIPLAWLRLAGKPDKPLDGSNLRCSPPISPSLH